MTGEPAFSRFRPLVEQGLRHALEDGPSELVRVSRYVMGWEDEHGRPTSGGGKRLRPLLCLEVAAALGAAPEAALPGAVAVELVHNFSLVHDDIQDGDVLRHGRPTAWKLVGQAQAINLGNFLYTRGLRQLAECDLPGAAAALDMLFVAVERMVAGQWEDIAFESAGRVSESEYLAMVEGKTGALLGAAAGIGAALAGADPLLAGQFRLWGERLGLAFQVHDDYLGTWGNAAETGKSTSSDIVRRKRTLPVVYALSRRADGPLHRYYRESGDDERALPSVETVAALLEETGAREHCLELATRLASEADDLLTIPERRGARVDRLRALARYIVQRDR
ncbi:MAG: dimethylallyltransferase [Tepidiforma sp.]|nr:MAG: dimethylallyltransferase [Tepidiforma sp.]